MQLVTYDSTLRFCWNTCAPENTRFARRRHLDNHMACALFPGWIGPVTAHRLEEAQVATLMHCYAHFYLHWQKLYLYITFTSQKI